MILFLMYTFLGVVGYKYFYEVTNDTLNPFSLSLFCWLFSFALCSLRLNPSLPNISYRTHIVVIIVAFLLFFSGLLTIVPYEEQIKSSNRPRFYASSDYKKILNVVIILSILSIAFILYKNNFDLSKLSTNGDGFDKKTDVEIYENAGSLRYLANFLPYIPILTTFYLLFGERVKKVEAIVYVVLSLLIYAYLWFVLISRGSLLISLVGITYLVNRKYSISIKKLLAIALLSCILFAVLFSFRLDHRSSAFYGSTSNPMINSSYNYITVGFVNLDKLLTHGSPLTVITSTMYSLSNLLGIYHENDMLYYTTGPYNTITFVYKFYHDLGYLGIVLYPLLIYYIVGRVYVAAKSKHFYYHLIIAAYMKPIITVGYGLYFIGSFSIESNFYVIILIVLYLTSLQKQNNILTI